jgi:hypothetical protein
MGKVNFSDQDLAKSAIKYRQQLLMMAVIGMEETLKYMTLRPGVRYKEVVGELTGDIEIGPYSETRVDDSDMNISKRELETYLGSVVKNFSPNSVYQSLWGSSITKGEALKDTEITKLVLGYLMKKISESLNKNVWGAKRVEGGSKTSELFDGFDTIAAKEIASKTLSTDLKNLYVFDSAVDKTNAVDALKTFYRNSSDVLRGEKTNLWIPYDVYDAYVDDYQSTVGATPYNKEFEKTFLEGSNNNCTLVPMSNKAGSKYIQLSTQSNMLIGVDQQSDLEQITVEKHAAFTLQFIATMFFGCQYESINKEKLLVGQLI